MKPCVLVGFTRKGCFQKEVSGFLESVRYIRKRWKDVHYLVNCKLHIFDNKTMSRSVIDMDEYLFHHVSVIVEEPEYLELPF